MEAVNNKIVYPCKAKVKCMRDNEGYVKGRSYLVEIYKRDNMLCMYISGNKDSEITYVIESKLLNAFKVEEIIIDDTPAFILTISEDGKISHKSEKEISSAIVISALEVVKQSYVLAQLIPTK